MGKIVNTDWRLDFAIIGSQYVCSLTNGDPDQTLFLGSINLSVINQHPELGSAFVELMKDAFRRMAATLFGDAVEVNFRDVETVGKAH